MASVIRMMERMSLWKEFDCYWLGTQIQRNYVWKIWYALKAYFIALFIIWRYDIVHFHTVPDRICLIIQLPILLLAKIGRKKVLIHLHVGNQLESHIQHKFFLWYLDQADAIAVLAKKWKILLKEKYVNVSAPVFVVYNACEPALSLPYIEHEKSILFAGALRPNKACKLILEAYAKIKSKFPDWHINIVGSGIEEENLKHQTQILKLEDAVIFTGQLSREETRKYFQKAGIYCMCSYVEGFPMVVLEAWTYGVPVISTPVGGLPEVIHEGKNICTFPFGDADALSKKLAMLMGNDELRIEMSTYSQDFVHTHFSLDKINDSFRTLYKKIV